MLFSIKLIYVKPIEEIDIHLGSHKDWLIKGIKAGRILLAGPLQNENGGFILAHGDNISDIQKMLADDPFAVHQLVIFDIQCCEPAIRSDGFPARWAVGAKPV